MTFWGVILFIIGLLLLGLSIAMMFSIFKPATPAEAFKFKLTGEQTSGWTKFFWGLVLLVGAVAAMGLGLSKGAPKDSQLQQLSWDHVYETPTGTERSTGRAVVEKPTPP